MSVFDTFYHQFYNPSLKQMDAKKSNINQGVLDFKAVPGAVLLDVRTQQEYQEYHIPESTNIPLQFIETTPSFIVNSDTPLFVYCYSGARSRQATEELLRMGYTNVTDIGGIQAYSGKVERK